MNNACNQDVVVVWHLAALHAGAHAGLGISLWVGRMRCSCEVLSGH